MNKDKIRILVIDDDVAILDCIRLSLQSLGPYQVTVCENPREALELLHTNDFATVISDVNMPGLSGLDVLAAVVKYDDKIPVVLITGNTESEIMRKAIHLGVYEFLKKPFEMSDLVVTVKQAVETHRLKVQNEQYQNHLESLVQQRTIELFAAKSKLEKSYLNTIHTMVNAMEVNDIYTRGHSERVTAIAMRLGKLLGLNIDELRQLRIGALLHDLGKIGIISNVLNKEQRLTESEYDIIKQHPIIGAKIIDPIGLPDTISKIIVQHHEWANGEGYPYGITLPDIHPLARIVSVADSFDAMTSQRSYRPSREFASAAEEVYANLNRQFDPVVGKVFYENQRQILSVINDHQALKDLLQEAF
jgi:putative nucleotidyltransferase with HDIG domain